MVNKNAQRYIYIFILTIDHSPLTKNVNTIRNILRTTKDDKSYSSSSKKFRYRTI